jgi:segregation and condensation protein B
VIGRPILYKTTKEFLLRFGLKDVSELPSMEEFEKMAVELSEETAEGESEEAGTAAQAGPEFDENAPEDGSDDAPESTPVEGLHDDSAAAAESAPSPESSGDSDTPAAAPVETVAAEDSTAEPEASNEHAAAEAASHD